MRLAATRAPDSAPWFWAVNGAASVWGSVLATALSLGFGIGATFWFGTAAYAAASVVIARQKDFA
jgi:hypothetical protein